MFHPFCCSSLPLIRPLSGFTFALNRRYGMVLAGLIIVVCIASLFVIIGRQWLNNRREIESYPLGVPRSPYNDSPSFPPHHAPRPSRSSRSSGPPPGVPGFPAEPPPRYESTLEDEGREDPYRNVGLEPMPWHRRRDPKESTNTQARDLGSAQTPRELL